MALTRGKGESKREFAARSAGGKLNYKTGKVTVAPKTTSKPKTSGIGPVASGQQYADSIGASQGNFVGPYSPSFYDNATKGTEFDTSKSDSKPLKKRESAAKAYNAVDTAKSIVFGPTAQASGGPSGGSPNGVKPSQITAAPKKSWLGGIVDNIGNMVDEKTLGIRQGASNAVNNLEALFTGGDVSGQDQNFAQKLNESMGVAGQPMQDRIDAITSNEQRFVDDGFDPNMASILAGSSKIIQNDGSTGTGVDYKNSKNRPSPTRTNNYPSPANNFFAQPQTTDSLGQGVSKYDGTNEPSFFESNPNPSPIVQNQSTVRRFLGNGSPMSTGAFSNGKGYSGLEGASLGMDTGQDEGNMQDLLNNLLGINTAQAAEMPQQPMAFKTTQFPDFQKAFNSGGLKLDEGQQNPFQAAKAPTDFNKNGWSATKTPTDDPGYQAPAPQNYGGGGGGYAPQSAPQQQGVDMKKLQKQYGINEYGSMIKDTEKANKAAQRDLAAALQTALQSINNQYDQSQTQGQELLNKQKQEADLKLSGLFNFANQDPNSEQRMQYQQRGNADAAGQLADLISKITQGRTQDTLGAQTNYNTNLANVRQQGVQSVNQLRQQKASALENLQNYIYKMQQDQEANRIASAKASGGGSEKNDSLTYQGDNANGEPVFWNNRTKRQQIGTGLTRKSDPLAAAIASLGVGGGQGGGQQIKYDENGRAYYEE